MVKVRAPKLVNIELTELLLELSHANSLSLELQFHGEDVERYRHWLRLATAWTILAQEVIDLNSAEESLVNVEYNYCDRLDIEVLTRDILVNYSNTLLAYSSELDETTRHYLYSIQFCLAQLKYYARIK